MDANDVLNDVGGTIVDIGEFDVLNDVGGSIVDIVHVDGCIPRRSWHGCDLPPRQLQPVLVLPLAPQHPQTIPLSISAKVYSGCMIVDLLNQYNMIEKNNYQLHKNLAIGQYKRNEQ